VIEARQPIFNVPAVIVALAVCLGLIQAMVEFVLSPQATETLLELFAFDPARYGAMVLPGQTLPGGVAADVWTFVTYALFHASWMHLIFNLIWLLAFGTPVARRFGPWRFLAFFAVTAAGGALAHLLTHLGEDVPVIGASAAVIGMMAAALRFVFQPGSPLGFPRADVADAYRVPAKPLGAVLREPRMLLFVLVWFGLNALVALPSFAMPGMTESVAWQAHIGGFVTGLVLFGWFDPTLPQRSEEPSQDESNPK
jgi:membrane associated rhomboid family serine protease